MIKKNRLSFSALSVEEKKVPTRNASSPARSRYSVSGGHNDASVDTKAPSGRRLPGEANRKRLIKNSTYQYAKKGERFAGGRSRSFNGKTQSSSIESKIGAPQAGIIRIIPLGGVEEVGRNMILVEYEDDIIVLDVGFHFVDEEETMGADYTLPNFKYLEERKEKIRAVVITHGHLDHIGGIPFIMDRIGNPPIYAQYLTTLMIKKRQEEFVGKPPLHINVVDQDSKIQFKKLSIRFFPVYHSIPDSMGVIIGTPYGNIIASGDMKLEHESGKATAKEERVWGALGKENNLLMIADSTSAYLPGFSISEKEVHKNIEEIIKKTKGRLIIGMFATQFERMIKIIEICERYNKKIIPEGRSVKTNVEIAKLAGLLKPKEGTIIASQDVDNYPPHRIVIIATGAQGEEHSALMRMATNQHKYIKLNAQDTVMLSSSVIPGNEVNIEKLKDNLYRHDLKLIHYGMSDIHSGGHARQEDLVWINKMVNPKFFMPGYGNHTKLRIHAQIIHERNNFPKENIVVPDNGMIVEISEQGKKLTIRKEKAPSDVMVVDGLSIGATQDVVIRDRVMLAQDGMFVIIALIDQKTGKLKKSPDLISRGFVYLKENQELLRQVRIIIKKSVEEITGSWNPPAQNASPNDAGGIDFDYIKGALGESISKFLYQKTAKRPLVIPVVLSV